MTYLFTDLRTSQDISTVTVPDIIKEPFLSDMLWQTAEKLSAEESIPMEEIYWDGLIQEEATL